LAVRTYDAYGVADQDLIAAQATVQTLLLETGIDLEWRGCTARAGSSPVNSSCADAVGAMEVVVRIARASSQSAAGALGSSVIDSSQRGGSLVTVFADRLEATMARTHVDLGTLVGRVIAHEIGHLLMSTPRHSARGLMRARWTDDELERNITGDWIFTADDRRRIVRGFLARSRPQRPADAVVAAVGC
jgi:hypothetical protein